MKRYVTGGEDRFDLHVDVKNYDTARRFLVVFFYLNDDFEGGETVFSQLIMFSIKMKERKIDEKSAKEL